MGFVMDGLDAEDYDRQYSDGELLRRILGYFRPAAGAMVLVGAMITLNSIAQMVQPVIISWGIDQIVDNRICYMICVIVCSIVVYWLM